MSSHFRLYPYFHPSHYDVLLDVDHSTLTFSGITTIKGRPTGKYKDTLRIHSKSLSIQSIIVNDVPCSWRIEDHDVLAIHASLPPRMIASVTISYTGVISRSMHGLYVSYAANKEPVISSQFESHHAREAFPCIDEPEAKATFALTLISGLQVSLSNMPIAHQNRHGNTTTTIFNVTPKMSTYLVAIACGDFQKVSTNMENGTEISVWSTREHDIESLIFPLEVAVKATEFLNEYFNIPYPLPKCDHVAIPELSAGAMENWGLITYRESTLIADPLTTSTSTKEYIATVIAHEISHQWFGNLVTMQWWDDLWLNESFATLMEYLVVDAIYPDWDVMLTFAANEAISAFKRDILPGVQSISTPVHDPNEINSLFDPAIVYAKGARLMYMVYHLVGNVAFRKGLRRYFNDHAYSSATGKNLWKSFEAESDLPIQSIMKQWIEQPGFPYVRVEQRNNKTILQQQQLLSNGTTTKTLWKIPLWPNQRIQEKILTKKVLYLHDTRKYFQINMIGGHYIAQYDTETSRHIQQKIANNTLRPEQRLLLLFDKLMLARCGVTSILESLYVLDAYKNEDNDSVWDIIASVIGTTRRLIEGDNASEKALRSYVYHIIQPLYSKFGLAPHEKESNNDKKLRSTIVYLAIFTENESIISDVLTLYREHTSINTLPSDTRSAILTCVMRFGTSDEQQSLMLAYPSTLGRNVKNDIGAALCATRDVSIITQLIEQLKNPDYIRLQDVYKFVLYLLQNRYSRSYIWDWLTQNWSYIISLYKDDLSYDSYPRYAASVFTTTKELERYTTFFEPLSSDIRLKRIIELGVSEIKDTIAWRKRDEQSLRNWLITQQ